MPGTILGLWFASVDRQTMMCINPSLPDRLMVRFAASAGKDARVMLDSGRFFSA
jgi:hypothetical protein